MTFHDRKNKMPAQSFAFSPNILLAQPFENRRYIQRITSISNRFSCCTSTAALIDFLEIMIWAILESVTYPHQIIHIITLPADSFFANFFKCSQHYCQGLDQARQVLSRAWRTSRKNNRYKKTTDTKKGTTKTTSTKKQQVRKNNSRYKEKQEIKTNNRYKLLIKSWDSAFVK